MGLFEEDIWSVKARSQNESYRLISKWSFAFYDLYNRFDLLNRRTERTSAPHMRQQKLNRILKPVT
jgi:hypothetical protein